jgi:hypothetical protein
MRRFLSAAALILDTSRTSNGIAKEMHTDGHKRWKRKTPPVPAYQAGVKRLIEPLLNIVSKGLILDSEHIIAEALPDGRVRLKLRAGVALSVGGAGGSTVTSWGDITGTLSDQADLQAALDAKSSKASTPTADDIASVDTDGNVTDSGKSFDIDGTLAANSDARIATQKAVKTYADTKNITTNQKRSGINFGRQRASGVSTGVLPFDALSPYAATIVGWWVRCDTGCTVKFRKRAGALEPGTGHRINTSGLSVSSGITKSTALGDFTTTAIAADDVIVPEITAITGTLTNFEAGLIVEKT